MNGRYKKITAGVDVFVRYSKVLLRKVIMELNEQKEPVDIFSYMEYAAIIKLGTGIDQALSYD